MIHIVAIITAKPGMREAILNEFHANMPAVHAEQGCIEYVGTVDAETDIASQHRIGPDKVTIVEKWASVDALRAHDTSAHMLAYRARIKEYLRGREIWIMKAADPLGVDRGSVFDAALLGMHRGDVGVEFLQDRLPHTGFGGDDRDDMDHGVPSGQAMRWKTL